MNFLLKAISNQADEIIPRIWVGSKFALDPTFLTTHKITIVINMTPNIPLPNIPGIGGYRFPILDNSTQTHKLYVMLPKLLGSIKKFHDKGHNILIHCQAGIQRAPTVAACYLMKYHNMNPSTAITFIKTQRKVAFINGYTFRPILFRTILFH